MAAGLGLLRPEGRAEAIDLAQRRCRRLHVELTGLRQIRLAEIEVLRGKEIAGLLTDGSGKDRRVDQDKVTFVEEVADGLNHLVADPGNGHLTPAPEPEVSML